MLKLRCCKKILALVVLIGIGSSINAQSAYDLLNFSRQEPQGTARFSGMGGAFNAVGGDFSTLSTNPAGIGLYRSNEFTFTPTLSVNKTRTDYLRTRETESRTRLGISNLGYIGNYFTGQNEGLISISYGIGYNKLADFNKKSMAVGLRSPISVVDEYEAEANLYAANRVHVDNWSDLVWGAYDMTLIVDDGNNRYTSFPALEKGDKMDQYRFVDQIGNMGEYLLSAGGNISNKIYFGMSLGMQDLRMDKRIEYDEYDIPSNQGELEKTFRTESVNTRGFGVNGKFGVIYRATDELRLGTTVHTPTFYYMNEEYLLDMESFFIGNEYASYKPLLNVYEYRMQSPYRLGFGLAYVFGKRGLLSVDYELTGYNGLRMRDRLNPGFVRTINRDIQDLFRNSSTVRFGAEVNAGGGLMLRGGFNYIQSPYKENFRSNFDEFLYSGGIGYRSGGLILDLAYTHSVGNYSYLPYAVFETRTGRNDNSGAHEKSTRGRFMLTLGFRL